jgi:hypothetical protein
MRMEALKADVASWSLASDQKLLEALQSLSSQFLDRSHACISKVNELRSEVATSEVSLRNTFNEFLMLGNSQFIENRVYDDDGEDGDEKMVSKGEEIDPMIFMREAFQSGFGALSLFHSEQNITHLYELWLRSRRLCGKRRSPSSGIQYSRSGRRKRCTRR